VTKSEALIRLPQAADSVTDPATCNLSIAVAKWQGVGYDHGNDTIHQVKASSGVTVMPNVSFIETRNKQSRRLWERSCQCIVGGGQAHKRPVEIMMLGGPSFAARGRGARFWDVDGNEYLDYLLGYGPIVLGHCDPQVNEAVRRQMEEGTVFSIEHPLEIELAETLIQIIPCAEMVMYFVGGSSATMGAIRCARAHTGREKIIRCGYHGWLDWCVPDNPGVPKFNREVSLAVPYNDLPALRKLLETMPGQVAGVLVESVQDNGPSPDYFAGVRRLCDEHGVVFILDEIKTGLRFGLEGAGPRFGAQPDLATFGKAMCNGYPGAVVVGKRSILERRTDTHMAATFHGDLLSVVAALTTIRVLKEQDGIGHFWRLGRRLMDGLNRVAREQELPIKFVGFAPMPVLKPTDETDPVPCPKELRDEVLKQFCAGLQRRGVFATPHPWFLSLAHTEQDIDKTIDVAAEAGPDLKEFLVRGAAG
jgi:glutamate-1-semialdehyde aminotransferase